MELLKIGLHYVLNLIVITESLLNPFKICVLPFVNAIFCSRKHVCFFPGQVCQISDVIINASATAFYGVVNNVLGNSKLCL